MVLFVSVEGGGREEGGKSEGRAMAEQSRQTT